MQTILASAARTTSDVALVTASQTLEIARAAQFLLTVSAAAAVAADTLDVFLQQSVDGGTTFDDFLRFTRVLGNGGAKKLLATWVRDLLPSNELHELQDGAMSAAEVYHGPVSGIWRIKWTITDGGAHGQSFTFGLTAEPIRR